MRATALVRWGITCLLLAPLAFLSWLLSPGALVRLLPATPDVVVGVATAWGVIAPIVALLLVVAGAVLNVLAIRRGVRGVDRLASGEWDAPRLPSGPRIILPEGWESEHPTPASRRRVSRHALGTLLAGALLAWPAITLGHALAAELTRQLRASLGDHLRRDYVRTMRSAGLSEFSVVGKHALRSALGPAVTTLGLQVPIAIGASVVIEAVFDLPGIGSQMVQAVFSRDIQVLQGVILFTVLLVVVASFLTDLAYALINPKVRVQ